MVKYLKEMVNFCIDELKKQELDEKQCFLTTGYYFSIPGKLLQKNDYDSLSKLDIYNGILAGSLYFGHLVRNHIGQEASKEDYFKCLFENMGNISEENFKMLIDKDMDKFLYNVDKYEEDDDTIDEDCYLYW